MFSSFLVYNMPGLFRQELYKYLNDTVIPVYEEFLKSQMRVIKLSTDQRDAISLYCNKILKKPILIGEEIDMNEFHVIFDHMRKNIILF